AGAGGTISTFIVIRKFPNTRITVLRNTFCHLPGVGPRTEQRLWEAGFTSWEALLGQTGWSRCPAVRPSCRGDLEESVRQLEAGNAGYFTDKLAANLQWRLFDAFRDGCVYLDIETTGLAQYRDYVTTIVLYAGGEVRHFVRGENLDEFP